MTFVGMDVHARSIHAAAIDVMRGELTRWRFTGGDLETPVAWLRSLPGPVSACYEAGLTGFGLYRAAVAAGVRMDVIAPGKTPRGRSDRVKTDRKDAELLARCLIAGSLTAIPVPSVAVEAARELARAHDMCRRDPMNARHHVSKMRLRHGRVYPRPSSTWSKAHHQWLAGQQFPDPISELAYVDLLAAINGLTARKIALAERISRLATDEQWWPTVAPAALLPRNRHAHRAHDPSRARRRLAAVREAAPPRVLARADLIASTIRRVRPSRIDHQDRLNTRPPAARRVRLALRP
jgi:transposase